MEFNSPIDFFSPSGQLIAPQGDLIFAPSNEVIVSGVGLRPSLDLIQGLGDAARRWNTLFAGSGNFLDRPTVNNSGILLQGEATASTSRFAMNFYGEDFGTVSGITLMNSNPSGVGIPAPRAYTTAKVAVKFQHTSSSSLSGVWTLRLYKNGVQATTFDVITSGNQ